MSDKPNMHQTLSDEALLALCETVRSDIARLRQEASEVHMEDLDGDEEEEKHADLCSQIDGLEFDLWDLTAEAQSRGIGK
jgi:hypothetical protein